MGCEEIVSKLLYGVSLKYVTECKNYGDAVLTSELETTTDLKNQLVIQFPVNVGWVESSEFLPLIGARNMSAKYERSKWSFCL